MNVRQLLEDMTYHLPPWQRGQVWTPAQQVALCETIWAGLPVQPMLLWERRRADTSCHVVVIDGQQRLTAMGARMLRWDGSVNSSTAAHLDLETGRWQAGPAEGHPPITMREAATTSWLWGLRSTMDDDAWWRLASLSGSAADRLRGSMFVYYIGPSTPIEDAIRIFRAWNVPGTPFDPDEVERLIRGADLTWDPPATD